MTCFTVFEATLAVVMLKSPNVFLTRRGSSFIFKLLLIFCFCGRIGFANERPWGRDLVDSKSFADHPGIRFALSHIEYNDYALRAICLCRYKVGTQPLTLRGYLDSADNFYPTVRYQVATERQSKWQDITSDVEQSTKASITIGPINPIAKLFVNMEPFRKAIGISRYGRLVLENGDAASFALEDLLPTAYARTDNNSYKQTVFQDSDEKKAAGYKPQWTIEPADLLFVISYGERIIGSFTFENLSQGDVVLVGTTTPDGDFWPRVDYEVANAEGVWKTIGSSNDGGASDELRVEAGKSAEIRVNLTIFRSEGAAYKFGRIVFKGGSGVFDLDTLNPK